VWWLWQCERGYPGPTRGPMCKECGGCGNVKGGTPGSRGVLCVKSGGGCGNVKGGTPGPRVVLCVKSVVVVAMWKGVPRAHAGSYVYECGGCSNVGGDRHQRQGSDTRLERGVPAERLQKETEITAKLSHHQPTFSKLAISSLKKILLFLW